MSYDSAARIGSVLIDIRFGSMERFPPRVLPPFPVGHLLFGFASQAQHKNSATNVTFLWIGSLTCREKISFMISLISTTAVAHYLLSSRSFVFDKHPYVR